MTNPEIISTLNAKLLPWLAANGITQIPQIEEDKNITPAIGFVPSVDVTWARGLTKMIQGGSDIANYISRGVAGESAMDMVYGEVRRFVMADNRPPSPTWTDFLNPPIAVVPVGPVGAEIPAAVVAMQAQYHPQIDTARKYYQMNGNASEGAETVVDGKRYRVVSPNPFASWLMLVG